MGLFDYIRGLFGGGGDESENAGATTRTAGSGPASAGEVDEEKFQGIGEMLDEKDAAYERGNREGSGSGEDTEDDVAPGEESVAAEGGADDSTLEGGDTDAPAPGGENVDPSGEGDRVEDEDDRIEDDDDQVGDDPDQLPGAFREEAQGLVESRPDRDFDFTPGSLVRLDRFVDEEWEDGQFEGVDDLDDLDDDDPEKLAYQGIITQVGSYFGETLVRSYDAAEWAETGNLGWVVAVDGPEGEFLANVFAVARDSLREPAGFRSTHDDLVTQAGLDAELLDPDAGDRPVAASISTPGEDADPATFREAAQRLREDYSWEALDFTPESLADLDRVVDEEIRDGEPPVEDRDGEDLSETVRALGSYLGTTLVESHDAEWTYEDGAWTVDVTRGGEVVGVEVFQAARSALQEGIAFTDVYERLAGDALTDSEGDDEALQEMAATQAQVFAAEYADYDLDFSRASLARLDALADDEYGDLAGIEDPTQELLVAAVPFSAYFGEVLRREFDAAWLDREGPVISLPSEDDEEESVGVDALQAAATCLAGNGTFEEACEALLAEQ